MQKLAKFNCSKNKTNKSCKPNQKSHIIHAAAEMQSLLFSCLFTKQKQNKSKKFVYKSAVEHTLKHTQVTQIFHCRHSKKSEFPTHCSPKNPAKEISKTKKNMIFFKEISLVQYMNKKKENQNIQLRSQAHPRNPPGKMNK